MKFELRDNESTREVIVGRNQSFWGTTTRTEKVAQEDSNNYKQVWQRTRFSTILVTVHVAGSLPPRHVSTLSSHGFDAPNSYLIPFFVFAFFPRQATAHKYTKVKK
jgi:hypothetical protein